MSNLNLSLFYVFSHNFKLYPEAYECPQRTHAKGQNRPILGYYFLISGVVLILLYILCLLAMIQSKSRRPVFQVMLSLAFFDIISLSVNSVITGILDIQGFSFCDLPLFVFVAGSVGLGAWMAACVASILLAIDRCIEINSQLKLGIVFENPVFPFVMLFFFVYWIYATFFTNPLLFDARFSSWFFDPRVGKNPQLYHNIAHTINNLLVSIMATGLYFYLCYYLIFKFGYGTSMWLYRSKKQIVMQAVVLCVFHAAAAYIYVYMQFFESPPVLIVAGQIAWQWSNGCFCVVYLVFNRTIRNSVIRLLLTKRIRQRLGLFVGVDEHIHATVNAAGSSVRMDNFVA